MHPRLLWNPSSAVFRLRGPPTSTSSGVALHLELQIHLQLSRQQVHFGHATDTAKTSLQIDVSLCLFPVATGHPTFIIHTDLRQLPQMLPLQYHKHVLSHLVLFKKQTFFKICMCPHMYIRGQCLRTGFLPPHGFKHRLSVRFGRNGLYTVTFRQPRVHLLHTHTYPHTYIHTHSFSQEKMDHIKRRKH